MVYIFVVVYELNTFSVLRLTLSFFQFHYIVNLPLSIDKRTPKNVFRISKQHQIPSDIKLMSFKVDRLTFYASISLIDNLIFSGNETKSKYENEPICAKISSAVNIVRLSSILG